MSDAKSATKKSPAKKPEHPPVAAMVPAAISSLGEKKGSSLAAIKKYISANYKVDIERLAPFIRKYLKKAVVDGKLTQTKGSGAAGSFKIAKKEKEEKPKPTKKPAVKAKKPKTPIKAKKPKKEKTPKKAKSATSQKKVTKKTPKKVAKKPAAKKPSAKKTPKKTAAKKPAKK